ncbi:MAG: porin family protein [Dysgonomonas sp.]
MNKKLFLILLYTTLFTLTMSGQKKFEPEWNIGVGFGPTFSSVDFVRSSMSGSPFATKNWQQYHGGLAVRYITENHLGLIAELNYSQQGWIQDFPDNPEYAHKHQLSYLELPILTHIYFGRKVRYFINLGPKLSYLINDKETISDALSEYLASGNASASMVTHQYYRKAEKKIDYGLTAGMGLEFRTGIGNFTLEGRYNFGFADIFNNRKSDYFSRSANRVISAKLTYYIKAF